MAADAGAFIIGQFAAGPAIYGHLACIHPVEQTGDLKQGCLAGPGRADQGHDLTLVQGKIHPLQDMQIFTALNEMTVNVAQFQNYIAHRVPLFIAQ
jgi:hypothetical protein